MQLSPALRDALRHLSEVDDAHSGELIEAAQDLCVCLTSAVESLLSVAVTVSDTGVPVRLTVALDDDASREVMSSLVLRLPIPGVPTLTVLAGRAGALDQLGADLPALLDIHRDRVLMDSLLGVPLVHDGDDLRSDIEDASLVNQAVGMLLGVEGLLPDESLARLQKLAEARSTTVVEEAREVLRAARRLE